MSDKLRICLVGVGRVSSSYFPAIKELDDLLELSAIVSRDKVKGEEAAVNWGAKNFYTSYEEMLKNPEIDAVILCLPHHLHEPYTIMAAEARKHILCEKPMALNASQATKMVESAERNNVTLMIGQSRRFYNAVLKSKDLIMNGRIGRVVSISEWNLSHRIEDHPSEWRSDIKKSGGRIIPFWGVHLIDYILWILEKRPTTVFAQMASVNPNWKGVDEVMVFMGFDQDEMANIHLSWNCRSIKPHKREEVIGKIWNSKKNSIYERYIIGEEGTIYMNDETDLFLNGECIIEGDQSPSNFTLMINEFAKAIKEGRNPMASGKEVIKVMETVDAAFKSAESKCVVHL